jgi:DNA-binding NarL/FixJ family response regulator
VTHVKKGRARRRLQVTSGGEGYGHPFPAHAVVTDRTSANADSIRVVIADDHTLYRSGLAELLKEFGIDVVGQAANGAAAVEAAADAAPDVVVMDLQMPGTSGVEATRHIAERTPASRVLVLTVSADEADVTEALLAGASGYVLKDGPVEDVVNGIRAAAAGESLISPRVASMLLHSIREQDEQAVLPRVPLSERELDVLRLLSQGLGNREIGQELCIEQSTVRNHVSSILMKLQVDNRVQAAVRAVRDRLV